MVNILVTGGAGFIGSRLIRRAKSNWEKNLSIENKLIGNYSYFSYIITKYLF